MVKSITCRADARDLVLQQKEEAVRRFALTFLVAACLAGCGSSNSSSPRATSVAGGHSPTATAAVVTLSKPYHSFVTQLCLALSHKDVGRVEKDLPYYQYNNGLRYGYFGDGEGHAVDPSILNSWLAADQIRCRYLSRDVAGHGLLLSSGWKQPGGPWNLIEMDIFSGQWKINDFTFAGRGTLWRAMHLSSPVVPYRG